VQVEKQRRATAAASDREIERFPAEYGFALLAPRDFFSGLEVF
jgi:hypothetical protein